MIVLEKHAAGVVLPVRAHAGGRRNAIEAGPEGTVKISVTQAPEKGKANRAIIDLLCKQLKLRKSQVTLLAGETSPQKRFLIADVAEDELRERLMQLLN